jgi:hypothetical protein
MKIKCYIISLFISVQIFAQARIMIHNDAYIVMNGGVNIMVDNNNANAISTLGTGGNIKSENENNVIQWNINTSTGSYIIPFTTASGIKIPLTINITGAGTGGGKIVFSTYGGATWDNDTYKPAGVTNMTNYASTNNSAEVIDRFWIIDAQGYTTKPSGTLQLYYDDAEHLAAGNTIYEPDLKAERYDPVADSWETYPVGGVVNTGANYVTNIPFTATDFVRSWTLIDQESHILPLVLTEFTAECFANNAIITWQTAQEINTNSFLLEESADGNVYHQLATFEAAGYTNAETNYSFIVENNSSAYYKLTLVNADGSEEELGIININCGTDTELAVNAFTSGLQQITLQTFGLETGNFNLQLFDIAGKTLVNNNISVTDYFNEFIIHDRWIAAGIYVLRLSGTQNNQPFTFTKKLQVMM